VATAYGRIRAGRLVAAAAALIGLSVVDLARGQALPSDQAWLARKSVLLARADFTVSPAGPTAREGGLLRVGGRSASRTYLAFPRGTGARLERTLLRLHVRGASNRRLVIRRADGRAGGARVVTRRVTRTGWLRADVSRLVGGRGPYRFVLTAKAAGRAAVLASRDLAPAVAPRLVLVRRAAPAGSDLAFPVRAAFYYPWFPETWTVGGQQAHYKPRLGFYESSNVNVVEQHVRDLDYAHVDAGIFSWWGRGEHRENDRVPLLLSKTRELGSPLRWIAYYEKEGYGDPSVSEIRADLSYLNRYAEQPEYGRVDGKPVVFVYGADDFTCSVAERWDVATEGRWYVVLKVFSGYRDCQAQPDAWHQYAPAKAVDRQDAHSFTISPGFWKADEASPRLARSLERWKADARAMVASGARWQLITTFNEWGEGTGIEPTPQWPSARRGDYLDALHAIP
jgi:glycosyl hydrolase family 99